MRVGGARGRDSPDTFAASPGGHSGTSRWPPSGLSGWGREEAMAWDRDRPLERHRWYPGHGAEDMMTLGLCSEASHACGWMDGRVREGARRREAFAGGGGAGEGVQLSKVSLLSGRWGSSRARSRWKRLYFLPKKRAAFGTQGSVEFTGGHAHVDGLPKSNPRERGDRPRKLTIPNLVFHGVLANPSVGDSEGLPTAHLKGDSLQGLVHVHCASNLRLRGGSHRCPAGRQSRRPRSLPIAHRCPDHSQVAPREGTCRARHAAAPAGRGAPCEVCLPPAPRRG